MCKEKIEKSLQSNPYKVFRSLSMLEDNLEDIAIMVLNDCEHHNLPFEIFETGRTLARQEYLKSQGMSKTLKSKHLIDFDEDGNIIGKSKAFDIVLRYEHNGKETWSWANIGDDKQKARDLGMYKMMVEMVASRYKTVKQKSLITRLVFGGQWSSFKDWPHIQAD